MISINYSQTYSLQKPISEEKYDINVFNMNMDLIDSILNRIEKKNESQDELFVTKELFDDHINNKENPHEVTKEKIGLGNVDNTSDDSKPVSIAQQEAINEAYSNANTYTDQKISDLANTYARKDVVGAESKVLFGTNITYSYPDIDSNSMVNAANVPSLNVAIQESTKKITSEMMKLNDSNNIGKINILTNINQLNSFHRFWNITKIDSNYATEIGISKNVGDFCALILSYNGDGSNFNFGNIIISSPGLGNNYYLLQIWNGVITTTYSRGDVPSITNNLLATEPGTALDAVQGKAINDKITQINSDLIKIAYIEVASISEANDKLIVGSTASKLKPDYSKIDGNILAVTLIGFGKDGYDISLSSNDVILGNVAIKNNKITEIVIFSNQIRTLRARLAVFYTE